MLGDDPNETNMWELELVDRIADLEADVARLQRCVSESWSRRDIYMAAYAACVCGGGGPDEGCPACRMYHDLTSKHEHAPAADAEKEDA